MNKQNQETFFLYFITILAIGGQIFLAPFNLPWDPYKISKTQGLFLLPGLLQFALATVVCLLNRQLGSRLALLGLIVLWVFYSAIVTYSFEVIKNPEHYFWGHPLFAFFTYFPVVLLAISTGYAFWQSIPGSKRKV